jgi:hypothetical protein
MNIANKKLILIIIILVMLGVLTAITVWMFGKRPDQNQPMPSVVPAASSTPIASSTVGMKTYTNIEFGFEFEYPKNWILEDDKSYSPFSKFTRIGAPLEKKYLIYYPSPPLVVNIVTPDFAERQFSDLKNAVSEVVVGEVEGRQQTERSGGLGLGTSSCWKIRRARGT